MSREYEALGAALVTVVFWASAFVGIRSAGRSFSPGALSLGRLVVAGVVLGAVCIIRRERLPLRAISLPLLASGLLWFGAYNLMLNAGERRVDAGTAAMLVNVGPVLIAILAGLLLREGFPRMLFAGCAVAFLGVVVIAVASANHTATTTGIILCLASAFAYSGGAVAQKVVLRTLSPLQTITFCCLIGIVFFLPFAPSLVDQLGTARGGAIGWLWLGESPAGLAFLGGALCLAGVALARRTSGVGRFRLAFARSGSRP